MSDLILKKDFYRSDDKSLFYIELGKGAPVLILPGWSSYIDRLPFNNIFIHSVYNYLERYRLIIFHPSNFYKSSFSDEPYTLDDYADEILEFIRALNLDQFHLVGHSAGGRQSIYFQHKYPGYVDKLVLMNSAGLRHKHASPLQIKYANQKFSKFNITNFEEIILQKTFTNIYNTDLTEIIKHINRDTLIIWGKRDRVINVKKAYTLHKLIQNSKLEVFEHLDHSTINYYEAFEKLFQFLDLS